MVLATALAIWHGEQGRRLTADSFFIADPRPQW
jgi:hypothetical protein